MFFKRLISVSIKRWLFVGGCGFALIIFAITEFLNKIPYTNEYLIFWLFLFITGLYFLYFAINEAIKTIIVLVNKGYFKMSYDSKKIQNLIYENRLLVSGPKIVTVGGGTGLSTMLRGLKYYTSNLTAIVTVGDDGGGSGVLREDLKMIPPGDIRNCILALADTEPIMGELLKYRFTEGNLRGQSFGNLFLAAMTGVSCNFEEAVKKMSSVLAVTGTVLPVTIEDVVLKAKLKNGKYILGESVIPYSSQRENSPIERIMLLNENPKPVPEVIKSIENAEAIILGPGSLYTSILPNLLVKGVSRKIRESKAIKIYICNIMTQPGETDNYSVFNHINAIIKHTGKGIIDYVAVNVAHPSDDITKKYIEKNARRVEYDKSKIENIGIKVIEGNFLKITENGEIRHDAEELSKILIETIMEKHLLLDKRKILEYNYLSEKMKEKGE